MYSDNIDLQRSASLTFAEITERGMQPCQLACVQPLTMLATDVREVDRDTLEPILFLLQNPDIEVQRAASAALGNLAVNSTCPPPASPQRLSADPLQPRTRLPLSPWADLRP